ncbi:nuclear RNA polymerase D1B [Artemisia annua]|uniref:Nuclear RNA polymerase D1B n=1 Tax=Artemisia annua TaxID=35608 RepID=A0A2U1PLJ8_ARTAN|nr:nuclear RNA polymerase D1B [Artemisia annua]
MAANEVEKLEKKMGSKIEEVRDMMLDRFCGVDLKLTAIEELLRKIMEAQNQVGNTRVKDTCKIAVESSTSHNKENKVVKGGHDGTPSREYGASNPYAWVGLYTNPYGKDSPAGPDFGMGRDFCTPVWVGQQESNFQQKNRPYEGTRIQSGRGTNGFEQEVVKIVETGWTGKKSENNGEKIVKTGQDRIFEDSSKGTKESCVGLSGKWDKLADKTNVSLQGSSQADQRGKKDSRSWIKEVENERNGNCGSVEFDKGREKVEGSNWDEKVNGKANSNDGWGKKADHQSQAQGSWGWKKNDDCQNGSRTQSGKKADHQSQAQESNFRQKNRPYEGTRTQSGRGTNGFENNGEKIVKTGQDRIFEDSSKGTKESCVGLSGKWDKLADKTNVSLQGSSQADQQGKKDSCSWIKEVENERNGNCGSVEFDKGREKVEGSNWDEKVNGKTNSNDGWGKKADHQSQAQGSWGWKKNDDWGPKRKRPSSPTGGQNDGPRYSGPLTATKQRLDIFTSDEQEILTEIDPIMITIKRILNQEGYNDGDPLSADDQTCIIDHVFNHHPDKDQKMGAGIDYVMVAKHKHFPDSRCFYVVSTDGRKEDFSYIKCLQNFVIRKYPDKGDEFISKYLKKPRPRHRPLQDMDDGSVLGETGRPSFQSGWKRQPIVAAYGAGTRNQSWHHIRGSQLGPVETKQDLDRRQMAAPRWGS